MTILPPFNISKWVNENSDLLNPPFGNHVVHQDTEFIVMLANGPNARKEFHYSEGEEFFYQIKGDMVMPIRENGKIKNITIKEGEFFVLPPRVEHSPQRYKNTVGLSIERKRKADEFDVCTWYCEQCDNVLYRAKFHCDDIEGQVPKVMQSFFDYVTLRTCSQCNAVMDIPELQEELV